MSILGPYAEAKPKFGQPLAENRKRHGASSRLLDIDGRVRKLPWKIFGRS
jgi:hypothetical protein